MLTISKLTSYANKSYKQKYMHICSEILDIAYKQKTLLQNELMHKSLKKKSLPIVPYQICTSTITKMCIEFKQMQNQFHHILSWSHPINQYTL